jgi:polar amino acid transport system permease protein
LIELDFLAVLKDGHLLAQGLATTAVLTVVSATIGIALGVVCAWARVNGSGVLRGIVASYVELIRNTPFIVQLFFIFFGLPGIGVKLSPEAASVLAMVINMGAYAAEIVRAGLEATPRGQIEAGQSLALRPAEIFLYIVLPPALSRVWPALSGQVVIVMLGSAVCGQIAAHELSYFANLIQSRNFRAFEAYIVATLLYLGLAFIFRALLGAAGRRWLRVG